MKPLIMNHGELEISSYFSQDVLKLATNVMDQLNLIAQNVRTIGLSKMVNVNL